MALVGSVAGALVAGGVYYGFSNLIQTRTDQLHRDMHVLSFRLADSPTLINAPSSAASRIIHHPRSIDFESRWNQEVAHLFNRVISWDQRISEWGRKVLYGEQTPRNKV
ncbi:hypothetical protein Ac2012v2_007594 [Leucoagaricus gongylophorus]